MTEIKSQNINSWLENGDNLAAPKEVDLSVLNEAKKYNIDLENLENVSSNKKNKKDVNATNKQKINNENWTILDVKLVDIANLVFDTADYPVFIVQDDDLVYINQTALKLLKLNDIDEALGHRFLELVYKEDWNLLAENIGDMLTNHTNLAIRFSGDGKKIQELKLKAIYLSDIEHFSFILLGEAVKVKNKAVSGTLYDEDTGLPSFFLFEDRLQMAVLASNSIKDASQKPSIAVLGININNITDFKKLKLDEVVIKRLADNLMFNLPKTVTIARGLKYPFWILFSGLQAEFDLDYYLRRIKEILDSGVRDNFMRHDLAYSIGGSVFPKTAHSAKELIERTVSAVRQAQESRQNTVVIN